jgi:hypothetical protein
VLNVVAQLQIVIGIRLFTFNWSTADISSAVRYRTSQWFKYIKTYCPAAPLIKIKNTSYKYSTVHSIISRDLKWNIIQGGAQNVIPFIH